MMQSYTGKQVKEIWSNHEKFCQCVVCVVKYTMLEIDRVQKMPEDKVVLYLEEN